MDRKSVSSSSVASVGYDADSCTLEIEFNNGSVYQYFDVNQNIYDNLMAAGSVGAFLAANIKGVYRFSRV